MPKTLTGQELQLDDGPARDSELFLVDGNNLAYRAFFALPEELATSDGFPTNALLGFTNMLFKLLADYRPKGVAVAWDTRAVHRAAISEDYKRDRRAMPDLLREQFPHFRPIVEAFGYRNLEFEGWEADDVIATLATRADEAGVKTTVVSTDRDAFQLVSENISLMMTPRGVADVNVYTPERVELRYGVRPDQVPDFIGLKGDTSDNIPGVPGIGDKTAGQLIAQYGSVEAVIEHADELSPARKKNILEHAEQARTSKVLATMRRDLDIDCDPTELVLSPPDRGQLRETFRRFEFRGLLNRVDDLDEAVPAAAPMKVEGTQVEWREGELPVAHGRVGLAISDGRFALAQEDGVVVGPWDPALLPRLREAEIVAHDYKSLPRLTMQPAEDTMIAAYLIEPARSEYAIDDLSAEYGLEVLPEPATEEETAALIRRAEAPRRLAPRLRERVAERGSEHLYDEIELPLTAVLASMEDAGVKIDTYRMGEITARLVDRVEELEAQAYELAGEEFMLGSTQQVARILFEKLELTPGRKGKTGYSTDTRVLRSIRHEHPIVEVLEDWRELTKLINTYLGPLPSLLGEDGRLHTTFNQTVASTGRLSTTNPNLQAIPIRTELGREIRSAFIADAGQRLVSADYSQVELRILAHVSGEPVLREAFAPQRGHPHAHGRGGAREGRGDADQGRAERRQDGQLRDHLRHLVVRALREPRDPPRGGAGLHRHLPRAVPARPGLHPAHDRAGRARRVRDDAPGPPPAGARDPRLEPADARPRRAARRQLGHAGHGRRRHQGRDDPDPPAVARGGEGRTPRPAGARRAAAGDARDRDERGQGPRPRRDVQRLSARPGARRRRRRRRRLERSEKLTRHRAIRPGRVWFARSGPGYTARSPW